MVCFENAKVIDTEELKEIIEETYINPTIERLMFIEAKERDESKPSKVFPCYLEAWAEADETKGGLIFLLTIVQSFNQEFSLLQVRVPAAELGAKKRIWDKPPTKGLRMDTPWVEKEVQ